MKNKRFLARAICFGLPVAASVFLLGRGFLREQKLAREDTAVRKVLAAQPARFRLVRLSRTKSQFNLLSGEVSNQLDIDFLQNELRRLEIERCLFAVRTDS